MTPHLAKRAGRARSDAGTGPGAVDALVATVAASSVMRATAVAVLTGLVSITCIASAQPDDDLPARDDEARREFEAGRSAYDRGLFEQAAVHFDRAYQLSMRPQMLFNLARAADSDGQYERAIEAYQTYLLRMPQADSREFVLARVQKLREPTHGHPVVGAAAPPVTSSPDPRPRAAGPSAPLPMSLEEWTSTQRIGSDPDPAPSVYPLTNAQRPLTLPAGMLRLRSALLVGRFVA